MAPITEGDVVEQEVRIDARPETIFAYFIEPEKMLRWKGISVDIDPRPGGVYRVDINGRNVASGEYVEVVPYSLVVFTWGWEGDESAVPPGSTTVEVSLTPDGNSTCVTWVCPRISVALTARGGSTTWSVWRLRPVGAILVSTRGSRKARTSPRQPARRPALAVQREARQDRPTGGRG